MRMRIKSLETSDCLSFLLCGHCFFVGVSSIELSCLPLGNDQKIQALVKLYVFLAQKN